MVTFLIIFHSLYFAMNFYVFFRMGTLFAPRKPMLYYLLPGIMTFSLMLAIITRETVSGLIGHLAYVTAATWLGILWLFFCALIIYEIARLIVPIKPLYAGVAILAVVGLLATFSIAWAQHFRIRHIFIENPQSLRLVQISDLHLGSVHAGYGRRIVRAINDLNPDAVLITGDLVDAGDRTSLEKLQILRDIQSPVFFSIGNHEWYLGIDNVLPILREMDFNILRNQAFHFRGIRLIGIDDNNSRDYVARQLALIPADPDIFTILLYHRPEGFVDAAEAGVDLMLSGHTHNGQIFPFNFIVRRVFPYSCGLYREGDAILYVNPGTGTWGPRMRLGSTSEITVINLGPVIEAN